MMTMSTRMKKDLPVRFHFGHCHSVQLPTIVLLCWSLLLLFIFISICTANDFNDQHNNNDNATSEVVLQLLKQNQTNFKNLVGKDDQEEEKVKEEDPLLVAGYFEGDIIGVNLDELSSRNAINNGERMWMDGKIPYELPFLEFSIIDRHMIKMAMDEFERETCIRFSPRNSEADYIRFKKGRGCYSHVGRVGGKQEISIGKGCAAKGIIMHELNHVVGFWHEQSRPDRDNYIIVQWDNIQKGTEANFAKYTLDLVQNLNEKYDYNSLMHYGPYSFSKYRHRKTIEAKFKVGGMKMGQREGFTSIDLAKINKLYNCTEQMARLKNAPTKPDKNIAADIIDRVTEFIQSLIDTVQ